MKTPKSSGAADIEAGADIDTTQHSWVQKVLGLRWLPGWVQISVLCLVMMFSLPQSLQIWSEVSKKLEELRGSENDNVIWNLTQLEVEYLKLERSLTAVAASPAPDAAQLAEVRRRFNIYFSRLTTLDKGAFYSRAFENYGTKQMLEQLRSEVVALTVLIDQPDAQLFAAVPDILAQQQGNARVVRRIINKGNQFTGDAGQETRDELSRLLLRLSTALGVSFVALALATLLLYRNSRWNHARAIEHKNASARFAAVIATSPDALIVTDAVGVIVEFNQAAETLFAAPRADMLGNDLQQHLQKTNGTAARLPLPDMEPGGAVQLQALCSDGHMTVPVELSQGVTEVQAQRFYVYFLRDVSDRLAADQALLASRDRAWAGEQAKSRFLAVMSHEMRTPLNGILGLIEVLRSGGLGHEDQQRYLRLMRNSSQILLGHVNDVLDITKLEADGLRLNPHRFNLDQLLADLMEAMTLAALAHGNSLSLDVPDEAFGDCLGDGNRLRQVLTNLLSNAIKFTENGEITLSVTCHSAPVLGQVGGTAKLALEFQIADTGIGIAEADQDRIFGDFVRLEHAGQPHVEGTGLGLGIAKRIVSAMGGRIGVDSLEGEGSVFWVRVDLPSLADTPTEAQGTPNDPAAQLAALDRPQRILVVEDNATNRLVVRSLLERDGHDVVEEVNGKLGVARARDEHFDVIFMDINMPVMGGLEASRLIRQSGQCQHSRIVALTAHVMEREDDVYREAGMDAVLSKPLQWENLRRVLKGEAVRITKEEAQNGLFDQDHLDKVLDALGPQKAQHLIAGVREEGNALIERFQHLSGQPLDDELRRDLLAQVHAMAGSASMLGARRLRSALNTFESECERSRRIDLQAWCLDLTTIWQDTHAVMEELEARHIKL